MEEEICLLNDSFYPTLDGVANAVMNYARVISASGGRVSVVAPKDRAADDGRFAYPVFRYPGVDLSKTVGYTAGNPFDIPTLVELRQRNIGLVHSHCPVMSNVLARELRASLHVPMILTYHTKFDVEITKYVKGELLQQGVIRALVESISSCDELWTVSDGAGKSIQALGYEGDYVVMPNGVDIPRGRALPREVEQASGGYDLPDGVPLYLFVGRMMWYKGLRIILDALAALRSRNMDFRMVFVGGGGDFGAVKAYAAELGLTDRCFFTGPIHDRRELLAWYTRADLFLFPSTFDTNGLVVREAAAAELPTVMVRGSCAAEGVTDCGNGFLIGENAASLAVCLAEIAWHPGKVREVGKAASRELYLSWDDAVKRAMERYEIVLDRHKAGGYRKKRKVTDGIIDIYGDFVSAVEQMDLLWKELKKL